MQVTVNDFKNALALFEAEFIGTMKNSFQKFLAGAALAASGGKIDEMLNQYAVNGMIDVEAVKALVDAGMKQCGGELEIPVNFGVLGALGATPVTVKITLNDVDKFFRQTLPAVANVVQNK